MGVYQVMDIKGEEGYKRGLAFKDGHDMPWAWVEIPDMPEDALEEGVSKHVVVPATGRTYVVELRHSVYTAKLYRKRV